MQQSTSARLLVVMRHATAEQMAATDAERRLTRGGRADARAAGAWLAAWLTARDRSPDLALVSAAARTRETWAAVAEGAGWDEDLAAYDEGLYAAGPETVLDLVRGAADSVRTLVVIGHNPTVAVVAHLLDGGNGDGDAATDMAMGYPTSAMTVMSFDGDWSALDEASSAVLAFHVARA